jgi:hypothetical protein
MILLDKLPDPDSHIWYARKALEHGWSIKYVEGGLSNYINYDTFR